jgi:hypothetical protein
MKKPFMFAAFLFLALLGTTQAQTPTQPDEPVQIYRFILQENYSRAGDIHWIEAWESFDTNLNARQLVMMEGIGSADSLDITCYYALGIGNNTPIYIKDGETQPVDAAAQFWNTLKNREIMIQASSFVDFFGEGCQSTAAETVNGYETQHCAFEGQDASGIFLVNGTAQGNGQIWFTEDDFTVRYLFEAGGQVNHVIHRYEVLPFEGSLSPEDLPEVPLACFDEAFPVPDDTNIVNQTNIYAFLESELDPAALQEYYTQGLDEMGWEPISGGTPTQLNFEKPITNEEGEEQAICRASLRFTPNNAGSRMTVDVYPNAVNWDNLSTAKGFNGTVVQSALDSFVLAIPSISPLDVAQQKITERTALGYTLRDELYLEQDNSSFVALRGPDGIDEYYVVDATPAGGSTLSVFRGQPICGPHFEVDQP